MSFQFSPETFIREIDFQIEQIQSDITNLSSSLNERLDIGPPPRIQPKLGPGGGGFFRGGIFRPQTFVTLNEAQVNANIAAIRNFSTGTNKLKAEISNFESKITDLLDQKRIIQIEVDVRNETALPDIVSVPAPIITSPFITPQVQPQIIIQKEQLPLKELALIGGAILLLG